MNKERQELMFNIINKYCKENDQLPTLLGSHKCTELEETVAYTLSDYHISKDSPLIEQLTQAGFKVIYPAEAPTEHIARMTEEQKSDYNYHQNEGLIVDASADKHPIGLANIIASHYYADIGGTLGGYTDNSVTYHNGTYPGKDEEQNKINEDFSNILNELGYETETNERGEITAKGDMPYPTVQKSKLQQIFDNAKSKIQNVFAKLKSALSQKQNLKEQAENERDE